MPSKKRFFGGLIGADPLRTKTEAVAANWGDVKLLLDGSSTTDLTGLSTVTPSSSGYTTNNTTDAKFNQYIDFQNSGYFDVSLPAPLGANNEPFTVETWARFDSSSNDGVFQLLRSGNTLNSNQVASNSLAIAVVSGQMRAYNETSAVDNLGTLGAAWYHLALTSDGTTLRWYINGSVKHQKAIASTSVDPNGYPNLAIGGYYSSGNVMDGRIEGFRVLQGTAAYTSNFTPPTSAFPVQTGTPAEAFQDPGNVDRVTANVGVLSLDTAGPEKATSSTTTVTLPDYTTYSETQLTASNNNTSDEFGQSCDMSGDGTITVFGAPFEDGATNTTSNSGAVYVFENGTEVAILRASDSAASYQFGWDVAISNDGSTIAVGSPQRSSGGTYFSDGAVYVYEKPTNGWTTTSSEDARLTHTAASNSESLGRSVAISDNGDTIVVGRSGGQGGTAPNVVHVYEKPTNGWANTSSSAVLSASNGEYADDFGSGLAISGDGSVIAIGAPDEDTTQIGSGTVYVYERPTNGWATATEDHFLGAPTRTSGAGFGYSCSLNEDGTILAVGEYNYGNGGRVLVLEYNGSSWGHSAALTAGTSGNAGINVDISRDGTTVAASDNTYNSTEGAIYIWVKPSSGWANSSYHRLITAANGNSNDSLGGTPGGSFQWNHCLTLSNDGGKVLSAAPEDDDTNVDSGSGFLFAATTTVPSSTTTTTTTQTPQWFWGGLRGRDALVVGSGEGDDKSLRFDGSADYLLTGAVSASNQQTFTTSAWIKLSDDPSADVAILASGSVGAGPNYQVGLTVTANNDLFWFEYRSGWVAQYRTQNTLNVGRWYHVVCQVDTTAATKCKIWIDGTLQTLQTVTYDYGDDSNTLMSVGTWPNISAAQKFTVGGMYSEGNSTLYYAFPGQLAEVHFVDGQALTAADFGETRDGVWVPKVVSGVTYGNNGFYLDFKGNDTGVTLLLDGTSTTDKSSANTGLTNNGVAVNQNSQSHPYASGALLFDGSDDLTITTENDNLYLGTDDWTIEGWFRTTNLSTTNTILEYRTSGGNNGAGKMFIGVLSNGQVSIYENTAYQAQSATGSIVTNTWYHLAFVRNGGTVSVFIDGSLADSGSLSSPTVDILRPTSRPVIGGFTGGGFNWIGEWADFRITKGYALYSGSFTPPTSALTNTPEYLGDFGVDRTTNNNDFSVEGNITPDDRLLDTPNLRFASFDPSNKGANVTLSEANFNSVSSSGYSSVITTETIPTNSKIYVEWTCDNSGALNFIGIAPSLPTGYVGDASTGWGLYMPLASGNLEIWNNGQLATTLSTSGPAAPHVAMMAVDRVNNEIHFGYNGIWHTTTATTTTTPTLPSSAPVTGIDSNSTYYIVASPSPSRSVITNLGQDHTFAGQKSAFLTPYSDANGVGEFYYQPPSGFLALADNYAVTDALATTGVLSTSEMLQASL